MMSGETEAILSTKTEVVLTLQAYTVWIPILAVRLLTDELRVVSQRFLAVVKFGGSNALGSGEVPLRLTTTSARYLQDFWLIAIQRAGARMLLDMLVDGLL